MSDNTSIPKEIMDKIEEICNDYPHPLERQTQSFARKFLIEGYQLRQQEVDARKKDTTNVFKALEECNLKLTKANETIEELRSGMYEALDALCDMWTQYCGGSAGHCFMSAGENAMDVLEEHNLLKNTTICCGEIDWDKLTELKQSNNFRSNLQSALTHEKEMRSREKDQYEKRIAELETRIRQLENTVFELERLP